METSVNLGHGPDQSLILMEGSLFWILIEAYFPKSKLFCFLFFPNAFGRCFQIEKLSREEASTCSHSAAVLLPHTLWGPGLWAA